MAEFKATGNLQAGDVTLTATLGVIANFAFQHFTAAKLFARATDRLEAEHAGAAYGAFFLEIRAYCSGTILSAVGAMEALINELYIAHYSPLRAKLADFETEFWGKRGIERKTIIEKYELALRLLSLPRLDKSTMTYQDAVSLIYLRNTLVHFKPTWDAKRDWLVELEANLAARFPLSPWHGDGSDFITERCMSAGCAHWAVGTCRAFIADFARVSGLDSKKIGRFA